jgi:PadR family transcriptional regulator, regulatory protein PadR
MAFREPRMTPQTLAVLRFMLRDPTVAQYGLFIAQETGLKTGTLHPILTRLRGAGCLTSEWETLARA